MKRLDIPRIKAICFDVDGTLSDTDDQWADILTRFSTPLTWLLPHTPELLARHMTMGAMSKANLAYHLLDKLTLDDEAERVLHWLSTRRSSGEGWHFELIAGVDTALRQVYGKYPLAVASTRGNDSTLAFLDQFGLRTLFRSIVTSQTTLYTKPHPHPLLHAAAELGCEPSELLMVGDTTVDILSAQAAGCQSVGVLSGFGYTQELIEAGADVVIDSVADLPALLQL